MNRLVTIVNFGDRSSSPATLKIYTALIHSSTYLAFTYYNRTFTNTIETILFSLLLLVILESLQQSSKHCQRYKTIVSIKIGSLLSIGFFNRPTFVIFAAIPLLFWICSIDLDRKPKSIIIEWTKNICRILPSFLIVSLIFIIGDSIYYDRLDIMDIFIDPMNIIKHLVITPWNFISYNIWPSNLANHGLHPIYFHSFVSMPLMFTLLTAIIYLDFVQNIWKLLINNHQGIIQIFNDFLTNENQFRFRCLLQMTIFISISILSLIPHHEPRFLLPLIIPIICLYGNQLARLMQKFQSLLAIWLIMQIVLLIFYGWIHQAGIIRSLLFLQNEHHNELIVGDDLQSTTTTTRLIFTRMYLPPQHLLLIPDDNQYSKIQIDDYSIESIQPSLQSIFDSKNSTKIFLIMPSCYDEMLKSMIIDYEHQSKSSSTNQIELKLLRKEFPNFNAEDLDQCLWPTTMINNNNDDDNSTIIEQWTKRIRQTFGMSIWLIKLNSFQI